METFIPKKSPIQTSLENSPSKHSILNVSTSFRSPNGREISTIFTNHVTDYGLRAHTSHTVQNKISPERIIKLMHAVLRELDIRVSPLWPSLVGASIRCILAERKIRSTFSFGTPSPPQPRQATLQEIQFPRQQRRIYRTAEREGQGWAALLSYEYRNSLSLSLLSGRRPPRIRFLDNTFRRCSSSNAFASYISSALFPAARRKSGGYP